MVLLSGGLDSATTLAVARHEGWICHAITFDYGQRHRAELSGARAVSERLGAESFQVIKLDLNVVGGSALTDPSIGVPEGATESQPIPVTYVPARNTIFLSIALGYAEVRNCYDLFIGVNAVDYSGYPDCRPEFIAAFQSLAQLATKAGVEGKLFKVHAPLMQLGKADIIRRGIELGVDYGETVSCYQADHEGRACGRCDACRLRSQGFAEAGIVDPTHYSGNARRPESVKIP